MSLQNSHQISEIKVLLKKGADGAGIANIELTGQSLNVDTYTITLTNGDKYTFTVTNGSSIANIAKTGTSGNVDTYTITLTNGDTYTFTVTNATGSSADGITYDNSDSGLTATNVQDAIDEIVALITTLSASDVNYDNSTSGLNASTVQGAIDEVAEMTKHGIVELWKNSNISAVFAGQSISFDYDTTIYDGIHLCCEPNIGEARPSDVFAIDNDVLNISGWLGLIEHSSFDVTTSKVVNYTRTVTTSYNSGTKKLTLTFSDGKANTQNAIGTPSTQATDNGRMTPTSVLGLIHNS